MFERFLHTQGAIGLAQAVAVAALALGIAALADRRMRATSAAAKGILPDLAVALLRGLGQILVVGLGIVLLLRGPDWTAWPVLAAMMLAGATIVSQRAKRIPRAFSLALTCLGVAAGGVIGLMTLLGVIRPSIIMLVPVGSMIIANSMNIQALFLDRLYGEVTSHVGEIESALALGATGQTAVLPYLNAAFRASLIPATDNLRSLGIVWVPGLMAGMVLSGSSPVDAALYQFVVLAMIFASGGLSCLLASHLVTRRIFTVHEQLLLRP